MDYPYHDEDRRNAITQGLLGAGLAALGARKGSEFNALAQAGLLGLGQYNTSLRDSTNAREQQQLLAMRRQQLDQQQQAWQQQQQAWQQQQVDRAALQDAYAKSLTPGTQTQDATTPAGFDQNAYIRNLQLAGPVGLREAAQYAQMIAKESQFEKFKPEHYTSSSIAKYMQTRNPNDLVLNEKPTERWVDIPSPPGAPPGQQWQRSTLTGEIKAKGSVAPVTNVSVRNVAETEENKSIGKARGEAYAAINANAQKTQARLNLLSAIDTVMGETETSALTPAWNKFAATAKAAGITIDPNLSRKEAAQGVMNQLALESRNTAEGGGMPGAMSDKDREFLISMNPNMAQTTQGRKTLIEVQRRVSKRQQQVAQWAREYRAKAGTFDEGFQDYLAQKTAAMPLFDDMYSTTQPDSLRASGGRIKGPGQPRVVDWKDLP